jgi:hypothetical protein
VSFIAFCSAALGKPVQSQLAVMGDMSLGGTIVQVRNLAEACRLPLMRVPKAHLAAHVQRYRYSFCTWGIVCQVSDGFLFGSGGRGV